MSVLEEMHAAAIARRRRLGAPAIMGHNRYGRGQTGLEAVEKEQAPKPVDVLVVEPKKVVRDVLHLPPPPVPRTQAQQIVWEVAEEHGVTVVDIKSSRRERKVVLARHECCYRLCTETELSLPAIGRFMGGRDHTSILHGKRSHAYRIGDMERAGPLAANNGKKKTSA